MAAKKKEETVDPTVIVIQQIDHSALASAMRWADKTQRIDAAHKSADAAISEIVQKADTLAALAGDVSIDGHTTSPIEQERHAKRIQRFSENLDKQIQKLQELVAA